MTTALVGGCQESGNHHDGLLGGDKTTGHCDDVGVVVLTRQTGYRKAPTQSRTNALMLVEGDVDALTTATHGDAWIALALLNSGSTRVGKIRIVTTLFIVSPEVLIGNTLFIKPLLDDLLGLITSMIAAQSHRNAWFQN